MAVVNGAFQQGRFDGLCGLYATINACNALFKMNDELREGLFAYGIDFFDTKDKLKKTILDGMNRTQLKSLLTRAEQYLARKMDKTLVVQEITADAGNINGVWTKLGEFLKKKKTVAIIGVSGRIDHWTCAVDITEKSLQLCDSGGMRWLYKSRCTCGEARGNHAYELWPDQIFGLSVIDD